MLNRKLLIILGLLSISSSASTNVLAGNYESLEHLNSLAVEYIQHNVAVDPDEKIEVKLSEAGNQLRLATCTTPISINIPTGASLQQINTLEMTCTGTPTWHVYVPIDMRIMTKVVVARETIPSKQIISEDMVNVVYHDKNSLYSGYYKNGKEVEGLTPVSTMVAGTVLTKRNVEQPIIINRSQTVSIISRRGNIMVRAEGIAKSNGALNDTIKVLNTSSKRTIDAVVVNNSTVEVSA